MASINIRVEDAVKRDAERIFQELGISMTAATTAFYKQVIRYGGIPFEMRVDKKHRRRKLSLEQLFDGWNGDQPESYDWGELDKPSGREEI